MIIFSHRRSGTHLLMELIKKNFDVSPIKVHWPQPAVKRNVIYIKRDPLDTLTSCYHWWKSSGESKVSRIMDRFSDVTPKEYINGIPDLKFLPLGGVKTEEMEAGLLSSPVEFLKKHHNLGKRFYTVQYEDLVNDYKAEMEMIEETFEFSPPKEFKPVESLVGHHPRKGEIGDHKNLFTEEDIRKIENLLKD